MARLDGGARSKPAPPQQEQRRGYLENDAPLRPGQPPPPLIIDIDAEPDGTGHWRGAGDLAEPVEAVVESLRRGWMPVQVPSFLFVGGLTFLVDATTFRLSIWAGATPTVAFAIGYAIGLTTHFTLNRSFTFWARGAGLRRHMVLYGVNAAVCLVLQWAILTIGLELYPTEPLVWKSVAVAVTMVLTYLWLRTVVFVRRVVHEV